MVDVQKELEALVNGINVDFCNESELKGNCCEGRVAMKNETRKENVGRKNKKLGVD